MDCKGFGDWMKCLYCKDICSQNCPIETEDAFESFLRESLRRLESSPQGPRGLELPPYSSDNINRRQ